jgi:hypothetical protein
MAKGKLSFSFLPLCTPRPQFSHLSREVICVVALSLFLIYSFFFFPCRQKNTLPSSHEQEYFYRQSAKGLRRRRTRFRPHQAHETGDQAK